MVYKNKDRVCSMCGEPLYDDMDYCDICKDHTTALIPCEECGGEGWVEVIDHTKVNSASIDIPYKKIKCENCEEGWVEE